MNQRHPLQKRTVLAGTCWFTAIVNAVFSTSQAQQLPDDRYKHDTDPDGFSAEKVLHYGIFDIRPTLQAGVYYDDNIFASPKDQNEEDVVWNVTPGFTVGAGDYRDRQGNLLLFSYAPTASFFTGHGHENSLDHDARAFGQYQGGLWTVGLGQSFQRLYGAAFNGSDAADVRNRIPRDIFVTSAYAKYELSPKTSLDWLGNASFNSYDARGNGLCFNEYVTGLGMLYELTPKLKVGPQLKYGVIDQRGQTPAQSHDQNYGQALIRATYVWTEKVDVRAAVGGERRHYNGFDTEYLPVFELGGSYRPFPNTSVTLDGYRRQTPSVSRLDHNYISTGFNFAVRQDLWELYTFSLGGGYEVLDYRNRTATATPDRNDCYFYIRPSFEWRPLDRFSASIWYSYRQNDSDSSTADFRNNQVGLSIGYRF